MWRNSWLVDMTDHYEKRIIDLPKISANNNFIFTIIFYSGNTLICQSTTGLFKLGHNAIQKNRNKIDYTSSTGKSESREGRLAHRLLVVPTSNQR